MKEGLPKAAALEEYKKDMDSLLNAKTWGG
jgi:hypothetical protein